jgi:hypothetical protein
MERSPFYLTNSRFCISDHLLLLLFTDLIITMMYSTISSVLVTLLAFSPSSVDAAASPEDRGLKKEGARRMIKHARTTLINLRSDEVTPEEIIYFEDTWMAVFNEMGLAGGTTGTTTDEKIRSVVVDEIRKGNNPPDNDNDRMLGGSRALRKTPGNWFDIGATYETSCRLCGKDDDRRFLTKADGESLRAFEDTLCDRLRDGPFESMWELEGCQVVV